MIDLNLEKYHEQLIFKEEEGHRYIFDPVRKKYVKVQPEELVRQSWITCLMIDYRISASVLAVEKALKVNTLSRRFDLVLYKRAHAHVLFEFKSFDQSLTSSAAFQAAQYNLVLQVPYVIISNGISHYAFHIDHHAKSTEATKNLSFLKI